MFGFLRLIYITDRNNALFSDSIVQSFRRREIEAPTVVHRVT